MTGFTRNAMPLMPLFAGMLLTGCPASDPAEGKKAATGDKVEKGDKVDEVEKGDKVDKVDEVDKVETDVCSLPTKRASTPDETAWQVFVAAVCPTGRPTDPLAFEDWTEQTCIANPSTPGCEAGSTDRSLHGSSFAAKRSGLPNFETCGAMTTAETGITALTPFVPTTGPGALGANPTFCEEVYVNGAELSYLTQPKPDFSLTTHAGQAAFITAGNTIDMPTAAVEIKVDWLPSTSLATPFDCAAPPAGVFTEEIEGVCYALAGIHISSKLYDKWVWATFEPQSDVTNPNRCRADLYGECFDRWGASPATNGAGATTERTPALIALMEAAKLHPAFHNYRMTGVQIEFIDGSTVTNDGQTYQHNLGSSFTEFNAGVTPGQASCISCHSSAQLNATASPPVEQTLQQFAGAPPHDGVTYPATPPYSTQDFSWLLGFVLE
jgi:hypothetical protein